jgi:hypothetical protein
VAFLTNHAALENLRVLMVNFHMNLNHTGNYPNDLYDTSAQSVKCA